MAAGGSRPVPERFLDLLPVGVFLVSSILLLLGWRALQGAQQRLVAEHFRADAQIVSTKITERFDAYDAILRGAAGLVAASDEVSRDEWRRYVARLHLELAYPEILGVGYSRALPAGELQRHEQGMRAEGFPDYAVRPPGDRDGYSAVVYIEPFSEQNRRALGFDGLAEPVRREAMLRARDSGAATTSRKVTLQQEVGHHPVPAVIDFVPVYARGEEPEGAAGRRTALSGWAYAPVRMRDVMEAVLGRDARLFRVEVFDGEQVAPAALLHDSEVPVEEPPPLSVLQRLTVNDRTWTVRFTGGRAFVAASRARPPWVEGSVMLVLGLGLTGLSAALVASRRMRRREAALARSLRASEARFRTTFEKAPVGIFAVGADDRFLQVNERYCRITGWSEGKLLGMAWHEVIHPDDRELDRGLVARIRSGELPAGTLERRGVRRDGSIFWGETTLSLEGGRAGPDAPVIGVLQDVTARHDAEAKFREIAERASLGILILQDDRVVYANSAAGEILGRPPAELGRPGAELVDLVVHPEDRGLVAADRELERAGGAGMAPVLAYRVVHPGGAVRKVERMVKGIQHEGRPATLYTILDTTERERTEEELRKAQRLESLGLVAGGIAHDFNNLLTAVFGHVELALGQVAAGSPAGRELEVALSALARTRDLTRQLLTFATGGAPSLRRLDVTRMLADAVKLSLGGSSVRARFEIDPGLPPVLADEGHMSQLWSNLLVNARQAIEGAGEVRIRARQRKLRPGEVAGLEAGRFVEVAVRDSGHGIAPEALPRVFDPFFTTRPTGTGLGLATCYSIVRRHGGHVSVDSTPGVGTTITVLLPAAEGAADAEARATPVAAPDGGLRVLIMDDEPLVLKVGVKQLRRHGVEAEATADGAEAVALHRSALEAGRRFDLVLLDLTVPGGMGGAEAVARMRAADPGLRAVACSGYFDAEVMSDPRKFGFDGVLAKPYLAADLDRVIAEALGARA